MSLESKDKSGSLPPVDPQVISSALNELHLDDDDALAPLSSKNTVPNISAVGSANNGVSLPNKFSQPLPPNGLHMFQPQHQMMGMNFVPYSHMMPIPPHGFPGSTIDPLWQDGSADGDDKNVSSFRRQTFHAISQNDLINMAATNVPATTTENLITAGGNATPSTVQARTQSISLETEFGTTPVVGEPIEGKDGNDPNANMNTSFPAAAYPYGGPLLQPNPIISGHHSPFPGAYGFNSPFQSFSPILHSHSPIPIHPGQMPLSQLGDVDSKDAIEEAEKLMAVQNGGTPPPWMYSNHPFGHMVPHGVPPPHHMMNRNNKYHNGNRNYNGRNKNNRNGYNNYNQRKMEDSLIYSDATLDQFIGNIYGLCKDQHGCRFLQKQLDVLGETAANSIFEEIKEHAVELMTDSFGNYLIQKILERVTLEQRLTIVKITAPFFIEIALNPHGTRALQKLVECVDTDEEAQLVIGSLQPSIVELSKDLNGNHVVQKCLQKLKPEYFQFIFDAACEHCVDIATHRHGCCVLQRCLDRGTKEQRQALCEKLLSNIDQLTLDPFGNYVVQYVITKESEEKSFNYSHKIITLLKPKIKELSLHKFGSNVVEKALRTPVLSETMILELLNNGGEKDINILLNDSYGNYVLQTALDVSHENNDNIYNRLSDIVTPLLTGPIRNTPHGRRIISKLNME